MGFDCTCTCEFIYMFPLLQIRLEMMDDPGGDTGSDDSLLIPPGSTTRKKLKSKLKSLKRSTRQQNVSCKRSDWLSIMLVGLRLFTISEGVFKAFHILSNVIPVRLIDCPILRKNSSDHRNLYFLPVLHSTKYRLCTISILVAGKFWPDLCEISPVKQTIRNYWHVKFQQQNLVWRALKLTPCWYMTIK